jgi:hypoxanthine-DNA glycosylase
MKKTVVENRQKHGFPPLYDKASDTLILGSFPSVRSRDQAFFYGHPQNRFWKIIAAVFGEPVPVHDDIGAKKKLILKHHLALYDVIEECDITGSSDNSIKNVIPADINGIIKKSSVKRIFVNGKTAEKYYIKYLEALRGSRRCACPQAARPTPHGVWIS